MRTTRVVVVGGGIVGAALAYELTKRNAMATVVERDDSSPRGSTAFAPGFVGVYNDADVLTELARVSVVTYLSLSGGFVSVGGVEVATTAAGADQLHQRVANARSTGLAASFREGPALPTSVPIFVATDRVVAVAEYPSDGVAEPGRLREALQAAAQASGARFQMGYEVVGIEQTGTGWRVRAADGRAVEADAVVLAGGVWGPGLSELVGLHLPLFPVAHPYVYAAAGHPPVTPGPFVRWPEHHVYARAHQRTLGLGTYDHHPVPVTQHTLRNGAGLAWDPDFDESVSAAQLLLHPDARFSAQRRVNGVFAMTPDNLPFIGAHPTLPGLWIAQAIWITHAAGAAAMLSRAITSGDPLCAELNPDRFAHADPATLSAAAMRLYRDIYANDAA